mgnify:CR=1 FL=1
MTYEELLNISDKENLIVKEKDIPGYGGRIYKNRIAIHQGLDTQVEKACVLAEELGHHYTTSGNILDQSKVENRKQEFRARMWAYNRQIGLIGIVNAWKHGCRSQYEAAEFLGVTEEFLRDSINAYHSKYGRCCCVDNYVVYFEPGLAVVEFIG